MVMRKNSLAVLYFLLFSAICYSQTLSLESFITDSLDNYIEKGIAEWDIPGLAIGIVNDGELIFNKGYGYKSVDNQLPVDTSTLFMIGSLTKAITCASTVVASEKASFLLNDPLKKWVPELQLGDNNVIVEDILTGRTGLGSHKGDFLFWKTNLNKNDFLNILPYIEQDSEVRREFSYNNISYLLINEVLLNSTGYDWARTVKNDFFRPLKMSNSYCSISEIVTKQKVDLASSHLKYQSKIISIEEEKIDNMGPAGSIVSTSGDMCKWMLEFINDDGVFSGITKKTIRRPYQLKGYRKKKDYKDQLRFLFSGMGWNIHDEFDKLTYVHDGGTDGSKSFMMVIPEVGFGVVVLTNSRSHNFTEALVDELHYILMKQGFQDFNSEYLYDYSEAEDKEVQKNLELETFINNNSQKLLDKNEYVGTYVNQLYGDMTILDNHGQLTLLLSQHQNNLKGKLDFIGDNTFWLTFSLPEFAPTKIQFSLVKNKVEGFKYFAEVSGDGNYWFKKK